MTFKGYHGLTQGDPMSSMIFNVVADAVIRYWVTMVTPTQDGTEGLGLLIHVLVAYLYAEGVWRPCWPL